MENYTVIPIDKKEIMPWLTSKHYAKRVPSISFSYGLYRFKDLVGVCSFGTPPSWTLCRGICGDEYASDVLELNRLVLENNEKNEASMLVGRSLKLLPQNTICVSFADTNQNHVGYVYQATNFIYTGLSSKFTDPKVIGLERQHHATYGHGLTNSQIEQKFGKENVYYVDRPRKHRYVYFCGSKGRKKQLLKCLKYPILPYPKGESRHYNTSTKIQKQQRLFV